MANLTPAEQRRLQQLTSEWETASPQRKEQIRQEAESIRAKHRKPYEVTGDDGVTRTDQKEYEKWKQDHPEEYKPPKSNENDGSNSDGFSLGPLGSAIAGGGG